MKLRIEISDELPEEIIIRANSLSDEVLRLQRALEAALGSAEMELTLGDSVYFLPVNDILFFETNDGKVAAHTANNMYFTEQKLYELENGLPNCFVRVSKSCILNSARVESVCRGVTGSAEARFAGCSKKTFVSRMYFNVLKEKIYQTRLAK